MNRISNKFIPSREFIGDRSFTQTLWKINRAIVLMLLALALAGCTNALRDGSNTGTTVGEIANKPNANLIGKTVTVSGEVEKVISQKLLIVEGDRLFNDPKLLVVNPTASPIVNDTRIQVTGTVRQLSGSQIESFDLAVAQELEVEFKGKPILIAKAIVLTPQPGEIAEEPKPFIGKTVTISGKVAQVLSPNAFTLDDQEFIGGKELLVVGAMPAGSIVEGKTVRVRSLVQKFVTAEIERDFDFDLQPELEVEYEGKAVAIAQSIQIID